jgi:hypothetical protein
MRAVWPEVLDIADDYETAIELECIFYRFLNSHLSRRGKLLVKTYTVRRDSSSHAKNA